MTPFERLKTLVDYNLSDVIPEENTGTKTELEGTWNRYLLGRTKETTS